MTFKESLVTGYITAPAKTEPTVEEQAAEILEASVADIKAGLWVCNAYIVTINGRKKRPEGCAVGRVGINGGESFWSGEHQCWSLNGFTRENKTGVEAWSPASKLALRHLAEAIPNSTTDPHDSAEDHESYIIEYNDNGRNGDRLLTVQAIAWFERAAAAARAA